MEARRFRGEPKKYEKTLARFVNDAFPRPGKRSLDQIDAPEILPGMPRIAGWGARYTADRVCSELSVVFRCGIKEGC